MDTVLINTESVLLTLPKSDIGFLKQLAKKMGWTAKKQKESRLDKSLKEARSHEIYTIEDPSDKDIVKQILDSDV